MERIPITGIRQPIKRVPISLSDLREPIVLDDPFKFYPVWKFEGVYEINMLGYIRKVGSENYINVKDDIISHIVILRHPDGDGSALCCNLCDVWSSTFLHDKALKYYGYLDCIKKHK